MTPEQERDARLEMLGKFHLFAVQMLALIDDQHPGHYTIRRWMQRVKLRVVNDLDPAGYETFVACQKAVDRALHPDKVLAEKGFVLP